MRPLLALGLALCVLIPLAEASSDAEAFTNSHLISYGSDFSALRTISNNLIATPDLDFQSFGEINTDLEMSGGTSEIEQSLYFSAEKTDGFSGYGSMSHSFTANNALYADSKMKCGGLSTVANSYDWTKVESTATGLTIALPGTLDYELSLTGGYDTRTTATAIPIPLWMTEEVTGFSVTFDPDDLEFDRPADFISQNTDIDFRVAENDLAYYGYDFERELEVGDISCRADMQLQHVDRD
jgi:hypothetical protein